jgi:hypothetical protein
MSAYSHKRTFGASAAEALEDGVAGKVFIPKAVAGLNGIGRIDTDRGSGPLGFCGFHELNE